MDDETVSTLASDTGETSMHPDYSTMCKDLLLAARKHRGLLGYCKPSVGKQKEIGYVDNEMPEGSFFSVIC